MRYSFFGSLTVLLASAGLAVAQPWMAPKPVAQAPAGGATAVPAHPVHGGGALPPPVWGNAELPTAECHDNCGNGPRCPEKVGCCEDRLWWSGGYLLYWAKHSPIPALVTTGVNGTPPGAIGQDDTVILLGNNVTYKPYSGGRISLGYTVDDYGRTAVEASVFFMGGRESVFQLGSDDTGFPVIARPFFATTPPEAAPELFPGEDQHTVSAPGQFIGGVRVGLDMDLLGAEVNISHSLVDVGPLVVDCLVGFRYLYMCETLDIRDQTTSIGGDLFLNGVPLGVFNPDTSSFDSSGFGVATHDRVRAVNHFYGGQIGLRGEYNCGCGYVSGKLKCAIGSTSQMIHVEGDTTALLPDATQINVQGGVLALAPNIGRRETNQFTVVPEAEINVGVYLTERVRIFAGYSFLYWSSVARPGEQLDHNINPSFLPTADTTAFGSGANPDNPRKLLERADFWLHGITTGFEFHY